MLLCPSEAATEHLVLMDTGSSRCRILTLLLAPPMAPLLKNALDYSASLHHAEQQDGRDAMLRDFFFPIQSKKTATAMALCFALLCPGSF